jgi:hypothetical protein
MAAGHRRLKGGIVLWWQTLLIGLGALVATVALAWFLSGLGRDRRK